MYNQFLSGISGERFVDLTVYETPERFEAYRLQKIADTKDIEPKAVLLVSSLEKGGEIVTYTMQVANYRLSLIVCNIEGKAPNQIKEMLGKGGQGHVRREFSTERDFAVKRQMATQQPRTPLGEAVSKRKLEQVLIEYGMTKICAFYELGPQVDTHIGFDVLCYQDCVQFHLELCQSGLDAEVWQQQTSLAVSLRALHTIKFIHRDIKPGNILFSPSLNKFVFADFGISHFVSEIPGQKSIAYYQGTETFMSQELLSIKAKQIGKVELYENDVFAFNKTLAYCRSQLGRQEMKKSKLLSKQISLKCPSDDFADRSVVSTATSRKRRNAARVPINNYEYLKLKFYFAKPDSQSIKTENCWKYLSEAEFLEIVQHMADSSDSVKIERALRQIDALNFGKIPSRVRDRLAVIRKISAAKQYNPEDTYIQANTEKSIKFKLRAYDYIGDIIKACENCTTQSSFVKETLDYLNRHAMASLSSSSKRENWRLKRTVHLMRGGYKSKAYQLWARVYDTEKVKSLLDVMTILSYLYEAAEKYEHRIILVRRLQSYKESFDMSREQQQYKKMIEVYSSLVKFQSNIPAFDQAVEQYHQFQGQMQRRLTSTRYELQRLNLLALFDIKYLLYRKFVDVERGTNAKFFAAFPSKRSSNVMFDRLQRTFLFRIGYVDEAKVLTQSILEELRQTDLNRERVIEELKELTYCLICQGKMEQARLNQQQRLRLMQRYYQSDDFEIVESLLLLAITSVESQFDYCRRSHENACTLFQEQERSLREQLGFINLTLYLAITRANWGQYRRLKQLLTRLIEQNNLFLHFERGSLWKDYEPLIYNIDTENLRNKVSMQQVYLLFRGKDTKCYDKLIAITISNYMYHIFVKGQDGQDKNSEQRIRQQIPELDEYIKQLEYAKQFEEQNTEAESLQQDLCNIRACLTIASQLKHQDALEELMNRTERAFIKYRQVHPEFSFQPALIWVRLAKTFSVFGRPDQSVKCCDRWLQNQQISIKIKADVIIDKCYYLGRTLQFRKAIAILQDYLAIINPLEYIDEYMRLSTLLVKYIHRLKVPIGKKLIAKQLEQTEEVINKGVKVLPQVLRQHKQQKITLCKATDDHQKGLEVCTSLWRSCQRGYVEKQIMFDIGVMCYQLQKWTFKFRAMMMQVNFAVKDTKTKGQREHYIYELIVAYHRLALTATKLGYAYNASYAFGWVHDLHKMLQTKKLLDIYWEEVEKGIREAPVPYLSLWLSEEQFKQELQKIKKLNRREHRGLYRIKVQMCGFMAAEEYAIVRRDRLLIEMAVHLMALGSHQQSLNHLLEAEQIVKNSKGINNSAAMELICELRSSC